MTGPPLFASSSVRSPVELPQTMGAIWLGIFAKA